MGSVPLRSDSLHEPLNPAPTPAEGDVPPLVLRAELALKEAVAEAISGHRLAGRPVYVWRDGRVQAIESRSEEIDRLYQEAYRRQPVTDEEFGEETDS